MVRATRSHDGVYAVSGRQGSVERFEYKDPGALASAVAVGSRVPSKASSIFAQGPNSLSKFVVQGECSSTYPKQLMAMNISSFNIALAPVTMERSDSPAQMVWQA